jgi:antitoxin HicB
MNNYRLNIDWSPKDKAFIATCPEFEGLAVLADSREQALKEAEEVLQTYIEIYEAEGRPLPKPQEVPEHSGQIRLRIPRSLHKKAALMAEREGVSLNTIFVEAIAAHTAADECMNILAQRLEQKFVRLTTANIMAGFILTELQESRSTAKEFMSINFNAKQIQQTISIGGK